MLSLVKRFAAPMLSVAAFALAPALVHADDVDYHVIGSFTVLPTGGSLSSGTEVLTTQATGVHYSGSYTAATDSLTVGTNTLTFHEASTAANDYFRFFDPTGTTSAEFGYFTVTDNTPPSDFAGARFQLEVVQDAPPAGANNTGTVIGSVSGYLYMSGSSLALHFDQPTTFEIPNPAVAGLAQLEYHVNADYNINANGQTALTGSISTPLPATASTGFALLGGLGLLTGVSVLRRRRQMA